MRFGLYFARSVILFAIRSPFRTCQLLYARLRNIRLHAFGLRLVFLFVPQMLTRPLLIRTVGRDLALTGGVSFSAYSFLDEATFSILTVPDIGLLVLS